MTEDRHDYADLEDINKAIAAIDNNTTATPDHGWQKVSYPKRQRKASSNKAASSDASNGGPTNKSNVFRSIEQHAEDRRRRTLEAQKAAAAAEDDGNVIRSKPHHWEDDDGDYSDDAGAVGNAEPKKQPKQKKPKKPKVTVPEAASKMDASDLAAFLVDTSASYESQQDIQLMRFADYFARAFSLVGAAQFPWTKIFKESSVAKLADIPLNDLPEPIYKTSVDWIALRSSDALSSFILWCLDTIVADTPNQQPSAKASKKVPHPQHAPSKAQGDVQLMVDTGLDAYRFSISWSRLIPNGRGDVNPKGLEYYNNLINELISQGIEPHVTLYHFDLPQILQDEYEGWLSPKIVNDFTAYADVCFREFGDRVFHWTTINEVNMLALGGFDMGFLPPQRCSSPFGYDCKGGNSMLEPYVATHNCLLAHASAGRLYKSKYQAKQHGVIGLNVLMIYYLPLTNTSKDVMATQRANDFMVGWFINPLVFGDYPDTMKKNVGSRLPSFSRYESKLVRGSYDFLGLNHYMVMYVEDDSDSLKIDERDFMGDMAVKFSIKLDRLSSGVGDYPIVPSGLQGSLEYFKQNYGNPPIYIYENGQMTKRNASVNDTSRVKYIESYIGSLLDSIRNGSNTRGYFVWSFIDVYEPMGGYRSCFGLYKVDINDPDLKRIPKLSAHWYSNFLKGGDISNFRITDIKKNMSETSQSA